MADSFLRTTLLDHEISILSEAYSLYSAQDTNVRMVGQGLIYNSRA